MVTRLPTIVMTVTFASAEANLHLCDDSASAWTWVRVTNQAILKVALLPPM